MSIFELTAAKMIGPFQLKPNPSDFSSHNFHEKAVGTDATGTDSPEAKVTWYLSHSNGVTRLQVDTLKSKPSSYAREVYTNLAVSRETTLTKFKNYHFLSCGSFNGNGNHCYAASSNGDEPRTYTYRWLTWSNRNNPITEYTDRMYSIGGIIKPGYDYFVEHSQADLNKPRANFIHTNIITFSYSIYAQPILPSSIDQPNFNTDNFCSTVVKNKIFIFPKTIFKTKNYFYIFNTDKKAFSQHKVPDHIVNSVKKGDLSDYKDIVVANAESTIFFALTKSVSTVLYTQLIGFYTESLDG